MRQFKFSIGLLILFVTLSGCSIFQHHDTQKASGPKLGPIFMIYSPNAEPLNGGPLGRPTCTDALLGWFNRIDTNHDGLISQSEFLADAEAQFYRMDIDKNGYLVSEELERYRLAYRQQIAETSADKQNNDTNRSSRYDSDNHASEPNSGDLPDPVLSADTNNDFKVTLDEFIAQAKTEFASLDADHSGFLTHDEILGPCKKPK